MRKNLLCIGWSLAFAVACAPGGSAPSAAAPGGPTSPPRLIDIDLASKFFTTGPGSVPEGGTPDSNITNGQGPNGVLVSALPVPGYPDAYNVTLRNTGSGYEESFVLQIPRFAPPGPRPMLVAFHRANVSHADAFLWTKFPEECRRRGWYFVAPLGGSQRHFSSLVSQINTQLVLDVVCHGYPIDRQRIYGVGFSMGGGAVATFAARHLDPDSPHFAAILNHTGTVSISDAFALDYDDNDADDGPLPNGPNLEAPDLMEFWNGGTPATAAFSFQRCSTIDIDPLSGLVGSGTDLARNLGNLKVMTVLATGDTHPYLPFQTQTWVGHLASLGVDNTFVSVQYVGHSWDALDAHAACEWFSPLHDIAPSGGNQLADEDGQAVFRFRVKQDQAGQFTPFQWYVDTAANRLSMWGASNLQRVSVDAQDLGLSYLGTLRWNHSNADGTADELLLTGVPYAPLLVLRDGQAATYVYDAQLGTCLLTDPDGAGHMWQIQF
jgi:predicted esterase